MASLFTHALMHTRAIDQSFFHQGSLSLLRLLSQHKQLLCMALPQWTAMTMPDDDCCCWR